MAYSLQVSVIYSLCKRLWLCTPDGLILWVMADGAYGEDNGTG
jgi:hypothetical protein